MGIHYCRHWYVRQTGNITVAQLSLLNTSCLSFCFDQYFVLSKFFKVFKFSLSLKSLHYFNTADMLELRFRLLMLFQVYKCPWFHVLIFQNDKKKTHAMSSPFLTTSSMLDDFVQVCHVGSCLTLARPRRCKIKLKTHFCPTV